MSRRELARALIALAVILAGALAVGTLDYTDAVRMEAAR